jgi:Fe-S-cluster containining protein
VPPYVVPEELQLCDETVRDIVQSMLAEGPTGRYEAGKPCYFLNQRTGLCRVYEQRPSVCRELPPGSELCLSWRSKLGRQPTGKA